ncbi:MAG: immune inhibitor A [Anaerolineae bacterium]|nr:immune inhibitor A [Anaerolineae bacterium]
MKIDSTSHPIDRILHHLVVPISMLVVGACLCTQLPITDAPAIPRESNEANATSESKAEPFPTPAVSTSPSILADLTSAEIPPRDLYELAQRFEGAPPPSTASADPPSYKIGDTDTFWVNNDDTESYHQITAELVYMTDHVAMWVEEGVSYNSNMLIAAADRFEEETYPTNHTYFGVEASPGIDGDVRLHILHSTQLGGSVLGYFYSPSEYPASVVPYSNEREIFYISVDALRWGEDLYGGVLAHEFQHMIGWNIDRNEDGWMSEGLSELAAFVNGYGPSDGTSAFFQNPDLQLNTWPEDGNPMPYYGAAYVFMAYYLDRFGPEAVRTLAADPANGLIAMDNTLSSLDPAMDADRFFGEWVLANWLQDPDVPPGIYAHASNPNLPTAGIAQEFNAYPVPLTSFQVHQYGTDYINLSGPGDLTIRFEGMTQTRIIPANTTNTDADPATFDSFVWWSNRGDISDMTLTRQFDLTGVSEAQLEFDLWYLIEEGWDYGYIEVSTDDGRTWTILEGRYTTDHNPQGNAYGLGYTGRSMAQPDANSEGWLHEVIDLSAYAGGKILLRFEMITDDAVNQPGMAVDNICITEIDFCDDAEQGTGEWDAQGFVRHNNILPQRFLVQVVLPVGDGSVAVLPFPLNANNQGEMTIEVGSRQAATLVVSGLTRYTTESAEYQIEINPMSQ